MEGVGWYLGAMRKKNYANTIIHAKWFGIFNYLVESIHTAFLVSSPSLNVHTLPRDGNTRRGYNLSIDLMRIRPARSIRIHRIHPVLTFLLSTYSITY